MKTLYTTYEMMKRSFSYISYLNAQYLTFLEKYEKSIGESYLTNSAQAVSESLNSFLKDYPKRSWEIGIEPVVIEDKTFCELINFKEIGTKKTNKPPMLIVAPLSGHYATLLKDTVQQCTKDFDVYVTDWKNCRDIPLYQNNQKQDFSFANYVEYVIDFMKTVKSLNEGEKLTVLAVCQPTVPVLVANTYLSQINSKDRADNIILMGGPVDTRQSPTSVNDYAKKHDINWFKNHVINSVPLYYKGVGREVYPGFLQFMGFVSMNLNKHIKSHLDFFNDMMAGSDLQAQKHKSFYDEYNSVMDLPAQYYLDTLEIVFMNHSLPKGELVFKGETINLSNLKSTRILAIEGELDDISGLNQTKASLELSTALSAKNKEYFLAPQVGHYGIFAGSSWRNVIYPKVKSFSIPKQ